MRKIKTGIEELDKILGGGLIEKSATLLAGAPGTGKTTLGLQFLHNGVVKYNEAGLFVSFEQFPETFYRDAMSFGWDLRELEKAGKLKIIFSSPDIFKKQQELEEGIIEEEIRKLGAKRIVIDNLSHFQNLAPDPISLRHLYNSLINGLKREGLTSLLLLESKGIMGTPERLDASQVSFVVDNIIVLRYVEIESSVKKALVVLKTRGSSHTKGIREFSIEKNGIVVGAKFEGREGILSGTPAKIAVRVKEFLSE